MVGGESRAVEENMPLVTAKSEPLVEKSIRFPSMIEFRHTAADPSMDFSRSLAATVADKIRSAHIVINTHPRIRFQSDTGINGKTIGKQDRRSVLESLFDSHI